MLLFKINSIMQLLGKPLLKSDVSIAKKYLDEK